MATGKIVFSLVIVFFKVINSALIPLIGPNVCSKEIEYNVPEFGKHRLPDNYRTRPIWSKNGISKKNFTTFSEVSEKMVKKKTMTVYNCCEGFVETDARTCRPHCASGCVHGNCTEPSRCECHPGYWGNDCSEKCPAGMYGKDCKFYCDCRNGGECNHEKGCICTPGYNGENCSEKCPPGMYGKDCKFHCDCRNGGECNHEKGCICTPGYNGENCSEKCPPGMYGKDCKFHCDCRNGGECNHEKGCICSSGYIGSNCLSMCPPGRYGVSCDGECHCENDGACDFTSGKCTCKEGWAGNKCKKRICPDDKFGRNCTKHCVCVMSQTELCHPWTGSCTCAPGYLGGDCSERCPDTLWGSGCINLCNCPNGSPCNHLNGSCYFKKGGDPKVQAEEKETFNLFIFGGFVILSSTVLFLIFVLCRRSPGKTNINKNAQGISFPEDTCICDNPTYFQHSTKNTTSPLNNIVELKKKNLNLMKGQKTPVDEDYYNRGKAGVSTQNLESGNKECDSCTNSLKFRFSGDFFDRLYEEILPPESPAYVNELELRQ